MFQLESERLLIRSFTIDDLNDVYRILDVELADAEYGSEGAKPLAARRRWLQWTVMNYEELAQLYQPPYGDRAIVLKKNGTLIGVGGLVPSYGPFGQIPALRCPADIHQINRRFSPEMGLFYAISPIHQRRGYATEAAQMLVDYAFGQLNLKRIVATTEYDNTGSIAVMGKLRMQIEKNPFPDPDWFQVVGILENNQEEQNEQ